MDRIIKITMSIFVIVFVAFIVLAVYGGYVENAYRSSLSSTFSYTCTITTDSPLSNLTLFIPVPADMGGNSPVIAKLSAHEVPGIPDTWTTTIYETGKSTLIKISIPRLDPPSGTSPKNPYSVTFFTNVTSDTLIDTKNPVEHSPMFRQVRNIRETECEDNATSSSAGQCYSYLSSLYANYQTDPNAAVTIKSSLVGMNQWELFGSKENKYQTDIYVLMFGEQKGWTYMKGYLRAGIGTYDAPSMPS